MAKKEAPPSHVHACRIYSPVFGSPGEDGGTVPPAGFKKAKFPAEHRELATAVAGFRDFNKVWEWEVTSHPRERAGLKALAVALEAPHAFRVAVFDEPRVNVTVTPSRKKEG